MANSQADSPHHIRSWTEADSKDTWKVVRWGSLNYINLLFKALVFRPISVTFVGVMPTCVYYYFYLDAEHRPSLVSMLFVVVCYFAVIYILTIIGFHYYLYGPPLSDMTDVKTVYFSDADNHFWVAECKGRVVGTIAIVKKPRPEFDPSLSKVAWLRRMFVHPDFRRRGIARQLLTFSINFCRRQGYNAIELITTEVNEHARQLYMNTGFKCVALKPYYYFYGLISIWTYELIYYL